MQGRRHGKFGPNRWTKTKPLKDPFANVHNTTTGAYNMSSGNWNVGEFQDIGWRIVDTSEQPIAYSHSLVWQSPEVVVRPLITKEQIAAWNPEYVQFADVDLTQMTVKKRIPADLGRFLCADLFGVNSICESHVMMFCDLFASWVGGKPSNFDEHNDWNTTCREKLFDVVSYPSQEDIDFGLMICKPTEEWKAVIMTTWDYRGFIPHNRPGLVDSEKIVISKVKYFKEIWTQTREVILPKKFECSICFEEKYAGGFVELLECKHRLICRSCVKKLKICPFCRTSITKYLELPIREVLTITEL